MAGMNLDFNALSVEGLPLSFNATYQARKTYYEEAGLPGKVDRWLISNMRSPTIRFLKDHLMLSNTSTQYITCSVQSISRELPVGLRLPILASHTYLTLQVPGTPGCFITKYVLQLTADASATTGHCLQTSSPRISLEDFIGNNQSLCAPQWTRWDPLQVEAFQQPMTTFLFLFLEMATWAINAKQVFHLPP